MQNEFNMKRHILSLLILFTTFISTNAQEIDKQSQFVGRWRWSEDIDSVQYFFLNIGERNDSTLISIGGTFYCGLKIHGPAWGFGDDDGYVADVRVKKRDTKIIKSKISESISSFYGGNSKKYNVVSFELLSDTTMMFILNDNKGYWPDTALMIRADRENRKFAQQEEYWLYKKEVE